MDTPEPHDLVDLMLKAVNRPPIEGSSKPVILVSDSFLRSVGIDPTDIPDYPQVHEWHEWKPGDWRQADDPHRSA